VSSIWEKVRTCGKRKKIDGRSDARVTARMANPTRARAAHHPPLCDALDMGRVIRGCRKGKGSVFTSHTHTRKGAAKHRQQVRDGRTRRARAAADRDGAGEATALEDGWRCCDDGDGTRRRARGGFECVRAFGFVRARIASRQGHRRGMDVAVVGWVQRPRD